MSAGAREPSVDLYWLPLGAGGRSVRWNGRVFEAVAARMEHRSVKALYHSALVVQEGRSRFVIEMAPVWNSDVAERGVVCEGPPNRGRAPGWHAGLVLASRQQGDDLGRERSERRKPKLSRLSDSERRRRPPNDQETHSHPLR
jgi:hypothetical protein